VIGLDLAHESDPIHAGKPPVGQHQVDVFDLERVQGLFAALERDRPDLSSLRYGVIALGDRTYPATFCFGGKRFDALLRALGATRIGEILIHDASAGTIPEEVAVEWAATWVGQLPDARDEAA